MNENINDIILTLMDCTQSGTKGKFINAHDKNETSHINRLTLQLLSCNRKKKMLKRKAHTKKERIKD